MEDLNDGLRTPGAIMLGGGNPAQIPEMNDYFQHLLAYMLDNGKALDALFNYDGPQGKSELLALLANMLRDELGWEAKYGIEDMCASSWKWQSMNPNGYKG